MSFENSEVGAHAVMAETDHLGNHRLLRSSERGFWDPVNTAGIVWELFGAAGEAPLRLWQNQPIGCSHEHHLPCMIPPPTLPPYQIQYQERYNGW